MVPWEPQGAGVPALIQRPAQTGLGQSLAGLFLLPTLSLTGHALPCLLWFQHCRFTGFSGASTFPPAPPFLQSIFFLFVNQDQLSQILSWESFAHSFIQLVDI